MSYLNMSTYDKREKKKEKEGRREGDEERKREYGKHFLAIYNGIHPLSGRKACVSFL